MVEEGAYCIDIVHQVQAVRAALAAVGERVLAKHLEHCVKDALSAQDTKDAEDKVAEVIEVIRRMRR
jgi:DNA-binding FrmR family transcriptional regulator